VIICGVLATVCLAALLTPLKMGPLALLFSIVVTVFVSRFVRNTRGRKLGEERARTSWPAQWSSLLRGYEEATRSHQSRLQEAAARWDADESARAGWVPETRQQVLKDGRVRDLRRNKQERQLDYAHLVAGLALMLARSGFFAGPTVATVYIAAYTRRRQSRTGVLRDDFVYDVKIDRPMAAEWDLARVDALAVLKGLPGRLDFRTGKDFKAIDPPTWAGELLSP
jgi:hypothetical protein